MEAIEQFCREYHAYKGITPRRGREQRMNLKRFAEFLERPLTDATHKDFKEFLLSLLTEHGLEPGSVYKVRGMIRPFFKWAAGEIMDRDQVALILAVESPRAAEIPEVPRPYSRHELDRFYADVERRLPFATQRQMTWWSSGRSRYRDSIRLHGMRLQVEAIVGLALYCGLRHAEIYKLELDDIAIENDYIVIRDGKGKGIRPRDVPYPDALRRKIKAWLQWRDSMNPAHDRVWLSLDVRAVNGPSSKMSEHRFGELLPKVVAPAWTLHRFRHTCATEWMRAGMRIEKVQKLLGHKSLDMTLRYAKIVASDVARSMLNAESRFETAVAPREAVAA